MTAIGRVAVAAKTAWMAAFRFNRPKAAFPLPTQLRSFRGWWWLPKSCRCGDHRIRFGTMAEIGPRVDCLLLCVDRWI